MVLMDPLNIQALDRIPKHEEVRGLPACADHWLLCSSLVAILSRAGMQGHAISLAEAADRAEKDGLRFFIEMFSHRWCHRDQPDDDSSSKARALIEWANYRKSCGLRSFFWIDYSCVDQKCIMPGVTMLPLYVATCNNIVSANARSHRGTLNRVHTGVLQFAWIRS